MINKASFRDISLAAAAVFKPGAVLVDSFDPDIFDDVYRVFKVWPLLRKQPARSEYTDGFNQTAVATARFADKRDLGFTATAPTRAARTPQEMKAIISNLNIGLYDRALATQQGRGFNLTGKDVADMKIACMRTWAPAFYDGDVDSDPLEFNGLKDLLGAGTTVQDTDSVVKAIQDKVLAMINGTSKDVLPTHVIINGQVRQYIAREYFKAGDKMPVIFGPAGERIEAIDTAAGTLPLVVDNWNAAVAGTPITYPTWIMSMDKVAWYYVEPKTGSGPDPAVFDLSEQTDLDQPYAALMFGALDLLGGTDHHARLNVEARSTTVDPSA